MMVKTKMKDPSSQQISDGQYMLRIPARRYYPKLVNRKQRTAIGMGMWNVRSLYMAGKLDNLMNKKERIYINIHGINELRRSEKRICQQREDTILLMMIHQIS